MTALLRLQFPGEEFANHRIPKISELLSLRSTRKDCTTAATIAADANNAKKMGWSRDASKNADVIWWTPLPIWWEYTGEDFRLVRFSIIQRIIKHSDFFLFISSSLPIASSFGLNADHKFGRKKRRKDPVGIRRRWRWRVVIPATSRLATWPTTKSNHRRPLSDGGISPRQNGIRIQKQRRGTRKVST